MPIIPRRFRRPNAELRIDSNKITPLDECSGGVILLQVSLLPKESFVVRSGWLKLSLLTTHFSRTVLDGYHEHTSDKTCEVVSLCQRATVNPRKALTFSAQLFLGAKLSMDSRPARLQWQAKACFEIDRYRNLYAVRFLHCVSPRQDGAPVVDGNGFLPLYEFGEDSQF